MKTRVRLHSGPIVSVHSVQWYKGKIEMIYKNFPGQNGSVGVVPVGTVQVV